jgi:hypothetical protein
VLDLHPPAGLTGRLLPVLLLAGCAATLPYVPERQPFGATISADVRVAEGRVRVEIDSEGYRVERAVLVRDDGAEVPPESLRPPAPWSGGLSIGLGVGAMGWGSSGSYAVGTGVGLGPGDGGRPARTTVALFPLEAAGPPPWRLRVKVVGVDAVEMVLDSARR